MFAIRVVCFFWVISLSAMQAHAVENTVPEPGIPYALKGVSQTDQLNVRSQPGADSEVIGSLSPATSKVLLTGVRQALAKSIWWQIIFPKAASGTGWVNAQFLVPAGGVDNEETNYPLSCIGTEPFWSLYTNGQQAKYSFLESEQNFQASQWINARGLRGHFVIRLRSGNLNDSSQGYATVLRNHNFCSDGMSDIQYPFDVTVITPAGQVYGGCCSRGSN
jgi:uncharacterized membrane protein